MYPSIDIVIPASTLAISNRLFTEQIESCSYRPIGRLKLIAAHARSRHLPHAASHPPDREGHQRNRQDNEQRGLDSLEEPVPVSWLEGGQDMNSVVADALLHLAGILCSWSGWCCGYN